MKHKHIARNNEINITTRTDKFVITSQTCVPCETSQTYREYFVNFLYCTIAAKLLKMTLYIVKHSNKTVLMAAQLKSISVLLLMH